MITVIANFQEYVVLEDSNGRFIYDADGNVVDVTMH